MQGEACETECLPIGRGATVDSISHRKSKNPSLGEFCVWGEAWSTESRPASGRGKSNRERSNPCAPVRAPGADSCAEGDESECLHFTS